jgi:hypothetical protein
VGEGGTACGGTGSPGPAGGAGFPVESEEEKVGSGPSTAASGPYR